MGKKVGMAILVLLGISAIGGGWWYFTSHEEKNDDLVLYGQIDLRDAQLAFTEQEYVTEILVDEGDAVTKGQVLASLKRDRLEAQLAEAVARAAAQQEAVARLTNGLRPQEIAQARAQVNAAEVRVENAKLLAERLGRTVRTGASKKQEFDDATANLKTARAELQVQRKALSLALEGYRKEDIAQAEAELAGMIAAVDLLQVRLSELELRAPSNGIIQNRMIEIGEIASPARTAFSLALTDPKWVRAYLPEPQLGLVSEGMKALIQSDSFKQPFSGWVGFIAPQAEFTPKQVETTQLRTQLVYETRVWVDDPENRLKLGMPVTVTLLPTTTKSAN